MIWKRLIDLHCPNCNKSLQDMKTYFRCHSCSFQISSKRYYEVVESFYKPKKGRKVPDEIENGEGLNNLGLEEEIKDIDDEDEEDDYFND